MKMVCVWVTIEEIEISSDISPQRFPNMTEKQTCENQFKSVPLHQ